MAAWRPKGVVALAARATPLALIWITGCALLAPGAEDRGSPSEVGAAEPPPAAGEAVRSPESAGEGSGVEPFLPPLGLQLHRPIPGDNPLTRQKVELGRSLFFDPIVSRDRSMSCASCHRPELAFADTVRVSPGVGGRRGTRSTPSLVNRVWGQSFFRDGRVASLEKSVLQPIHNPVELDLELEVLEERLRADPTYRVRFAEAFPGEAISTGPIARALASYVRTLLSGDAPFDRHRIAGTDGPTDEALEGAHLFFGRASCATCHAGPTFTDEEFHATGVAGGSGDPGRWTVTGREEDRGRFRTPGLREVERTAPYMHDGSVATLEEVVEFYDRGGEPHPNLSPDVRPLGLTARERAALVAFLRSLSGRVAEGQGPLVFSGEG